MAVCLFTQSASLLSPKVSTPGQVFECHDAVRKKGIYSQNIVDKLGNLLLTGFSVVSFYDLWAKARIKLQRFGCFKLHAAT